MESRRWRRSEAPALVRTAPFLDALPSPYRERAWATLQERARDVDAFVPVSRWYGDMMRERLAIPEERVHVVYNGIDTRDYEENGAAPPRSMPPWPRGRSSSGIGGTS